MLRVQRAKTPTANRQRESNGERLQCWIRWRERQREWRERAGERQRGTERQRESRREIERVERESTREGESGRERGVCECVSVRVCECVSV